MTYIVGTYKATRCFVQCFPEFDDIEGAKAQANSFYDEVKEGIKHGIYEAYTCVQVLDYNGKLHAQYGVS